MSEQRNADNTTADAESSSSSDEQIPRSALEDPNVHVSEEALKGPQGPAPPHSAEEFEQELKGNGKPPLGTDQDLLGVYLPFSLSSLLLSLLQWSLLLFLVFLRTTL